MGLACSCSDTELRKDLCSGNRDKAPQKLEGTFYFYENGPAHSFQPAVMNANGDYLNRIVESAENYWTGANVTLKDRHRPVSTYRISGVVRKNKFLLTKAEYDACCVIGRYYKAYKLRRAVRALAKQRRAQRQRNSYINSTISEVDTIRFSVS